MSPKFIMQFKKANPCLLCGKLSQRSMCEAHLEKARVGWRVHSAARKALGKCSYCNRKNYKGGVRCKTHVTLNSYNCTAWWFRVGKKRSQERLKNGYCLYGCGQKRYLTHQHCEKHYNQKRIYMKVYHVLNKG